MPIPFATSHWGGFSPSALFAHGEQGVWYDPNDLSSMYQDSAGTTAVTGVEQPVGKILDKSGRGNHATQSTSAARPTLSARVNLLTYTQDFSNAAWAVAGSPTKSTTTGTRPDGTTGTIDTLTFPAVSAGSFSFAYQTSGQAFVGTQVVFSVYARVASGTATLYLNMEDMSVSPAGGNFVAGTAQTLTTSWQRISVTGTRTSNSGNMGAMIGFDTRAAAGQTNGSSLTVQIWGADFRPTGIGVNLPDYQRVGASTDYDTAGFPLYLKFDGVDDCLSTSAINFTGTNKMSVFAGARKMSDAAQGVIAELSATIASNNGTFLLTAPNSAAANYNFSSKGTTQVDNTVTTYAAPISGVLIGLSNISAPSNIIRVNGTQAGSSTSSQGTGNYGNFALYLGRRNNASLQWNGYLYGMVVRGASSSTSEISSAENWLRLRSRTY